MRGYIRSNVNLYAMFVKRDLSPTPKKKIIIESILVLNHFCVTSVDIRFDIKVCGTSKNVESCNQVRITLTEY